MSRCTLSCLVAAVWCVAVAGAQRPPAQSDQQILIKLERQWNDAFYKKDTAFIASILAPEFVATYDDGSRGDKAKELALASEFNQQILSATQDDFTVKIFQETAVVWFTLRVVGIKQGQKAELTLRYTDVWVMRDGKWLCVSTHSTRVAK
jgi:ketosteroid isomerase-like protein